MEELLGARYRCYVFDMEGLMAALIVIPPEERQTAVEDICQTVKEGVSLIEKYFSISLSAVISNLRESFEKIKESYRGSLCPSQYCSDKRSTVRERCGDSSG